MLRSFSWRPVRTPAALACLATFGLAATFFCLQNAEAKAALDSPYSYDQTWNAALRLVRVDMGLKVTEKDDGSGYILFDYKSAEGGSKTSVGSMELVRPKESAGSTHVVVSLPSMPRYHEQVMLDSLSRKLKDEFGEPMKHPKPPPVKPDAGAME